MEAKDFMRDPRDLAYKTVIDYENNCFDFGELVKRLTDLGLTPYQIEEIISYYEE